MYRLVLIVGAIFLPVASAAQDMPFLDAAGAYVATEAINAEIERSGDRRSGDRTTARPRDEYDVAANTECFRARSREKFRPEFERLEREQGLDAATEWLKTVVPAEEQRNRALVAAHTPC